MTHVGVGRCQDAPERLVVQVVAVGPGGEPGPVPKAARVDGTTALGALFRVVLPAARPGVVAVAVYSFMTSWGEILFAAQMTNENSRTLSIGLQNYSTAINV